MVFAGIIAALGLAGRFYLFGSAVPVTLQTLGVMLAGLILGARLGALAVLVYLAIGAAGVPVFAGVGGLAPFAGVTAGYLIAFPIGAFVVGLIAFRDGHFQSSRAFVAAVVGGIGVVYAIGIPVLAARAGLDLGEAARVGGLIFLPGDLIKAALATLIAIAVHRAYPALSPDTSEAAVKPHVIEVRDVTHSYGDRMVLRAVSATLTERRIAVIGANGSGKSTFARLLNGLVVPQQGEVRVSGLSTRSDAAAVRRLVGFVFTDPDAQIVMPTVAEDVAFGLRRRKLGAAESQRRVFAALSDLGLEIFADHPAHLLSGGEKQLLALCSVLVTDPQVLVCDEPTTLLDRRNSRRVLEILDRLPQQVILVTHHLESVADYDRVLVFDEGALVADGDPGAAVDHYRALVG